MENDVTANNELFSLVHSDELISRPRALNSEIGGISFGTKGAVSHSLGNTTREMTWCFEQSLAQRTFSGVKNGIVAGVAGDAIDHELYAAINEEGLFNTEGMIQSSYSFAFPGAVVGARHSPNLKAATDHP